MWLVDTSVWIDHFRNERLELGECLSKRRILTHPSVCGELACGNLKDRSEILLSLSELPSAMLATDAEVLHLIEDRKLWGRGIGWVDAHLLASALLSSCGLWTLDKKLVFTAKAVGVKTGGDGFSPFGPQ